ncbi:MAG: carboxypeptidase-like regulatory domain-containing protein [Sphingobacteriaceae bacterium]|nr:MAG: carboxypeptidase-like regulatory domain-containing protein [Sphingobacteriaceae bacterium]
MLKTLCCIWVMLFSVCAFAQQPDVSGTITDQAGNRLPFTAVFVKNTTIGTLSNERGNYHLALKPGNYTLVYQLIGQRQTSAEINLQKDTVLNVVLLPEIYHLKKAKVTGEDPAYAMIRKAMAKRRFFKKQVKNYSCKVYLKGVQKLVSGPKRYLGDSVLKALSLNKNGSGILYETEANSQLNYAGSTKIKEILKASRAAGDHPSLNFNRAIDIQTSFYDNLLHWDALSNRSFVSPIASNAMGFYRYKFRGDFTENGRLVHKIEVIAKRKSDPSFNGFIYLEDGQWRLHSLNLKLFKLANISFVDSLQITQQFIPVADSVWLPSSTRFNYRGKILGFIFSGYFEGIYADYNLQPGFPPDLFDNQIMEIPKQAFRKDTLYWNANRPIPLTRPEEIYYYNKDSLGRKRQSNQYLDSAQKINNHFLFVPWLLNGYNVRSKDGKQLYNIQSPKDIVFYNSVERWGINLAPRYKRFAPNGKTLDIRPVLRYSFARELLNANVYASYRYNPAKQASFYGKIGSDFLDLNNSGNVSLFINTLSFLFTEHNLLKFYQSRFVQGGTQGEVENGILLNGFMEYSDRRSLNNFYKDSTQVTPILRNGIREQSNNPLDPGSDVPLFPRYQSLSFSGSATFTFNQQYTQRPDGKYIEPSPYPRIRINYRKGFPVVGSDVNYDFTSVDFFQDRLRMGIYGYSSYFFSGGTFLNHKKLYYPDYKQFRGGQPFVFDSSLGSFHYLNYYVYSTNRSYLEGHFEHNFGGYFLNRMPFIRKLRLEEIIGGSFLTQRIRDNYHEFYFGIKKLLIRFDYGFAFDGHSKIYQGFRYVYSL